MFSPHHPLARAAPVSDGKPLAEFIPEEKSKILPLSNVVIELLLERPMKAQRDEENQGIDFLPVPGARKKRDNYSLYQFPPPPLTVHEMETCQRTHVIGALVCVIGFANKTPEVTFRFIPRSKFISDLEPLLSAARQIFTYNSKLLYSHLRASPSEENRRLLLSSKGYVDPLADLASKAANALDIYDVESITVPQDKKEDRQSANIDEWMSFAGPPPARRNTKKTFDSARLQERLDSLKEHQATTSAATFNLKDTPDQIRKYSAAPRLFHMMPYIYKRRDEGYFAEQEMMYWRFKTTSICTDLAMLDGTTPFDLFQLNPKLKFDERKGGARDIAAQILQIATKESRRQWDIQALNRVSFIATSTANTKEEQNDLIWYVATVADLCACIYSENTEIHFQKKHYFRKINKYKIVETHARVLASLAGVLEISRGKIIGDDSEVNEDDAGDEKQDTSKK